MTSPAENAKDILVIYEEEAEEWALYLKSLFKHIVKEEGILLYNLEVSSLEHIELCCLSCYKCKLLILSNGLLKCLNQTKRHFLDQVLEPPDKVVILLCGVYNSDILYEILTLDKSTWEISTDQDPEEYLSIMTNIIQQGEPQNEELEELLSYTYAEVLSNDYQDNSHRNTLDAVALEQTNVNLETDVASETLEINRPLILVLPTRIPCENPGEIFILLRDEIADETVEIEFITDNKRIRIQPDLWNEKVRYMKALDFPAGLVNVNVYCEGVIKAVMQIEYYTAIGEIECILKKVADPIAFACQAFKFSSIEKLDNILTFLLKSEVSAYECNVFQSEDMHHEQANLNLEELPTLLHCAAKFGLKNLTSFLLQCPKATEVCRTTNKYGENPACIARKHGHSELQKLIQEFSINATDGENSDQEEEAEEDDTYVVMLPSDSPFTSSLTAGKHPEDQHEIGLKHWEEADEKEEDSERGQENLRDKKERDPEKNKLEEATCKSDDITDSLYACICDDDDDDDDGEHEVGRRDFFLFDRPPLPPREPAATQIYTDLHSFIPVSKLVEDRKEREHTSEHLEAYDGEEQDIAVEVQREEDEEDPYTFATLEDGVYDMILAASDEERRKERRSFIMNRPPAPAPRPLSSPVKEENTPYIVQVFQQKATRSHGDNEKMYSAVRKQDRGQTDSPTYTTLRHCIPSGQEELILLQERVKQGTISVDEALEKFKQWKNEKSSSNIPQQEKVRQLRDSIIGKRVEKENLYDKITIEHHPHVSK
ncbi:PREDICTED: B-cell scaffold protein with ankyrin repeats isoform X2 [Gavialis gangeticus]|uniref:B-cell scaffold protein with ankyrin repeats isoform X1 n=1 Tax=Gavialis gangeticus TaxID=94835 RepID=UPI00092E2B43|nr:PREDICTED: B-cell scaffold protein with ankyrin repeats isoform X1 [Gavialis gangeticus]XP_019382055.1 PREDICTED: B-cell scaffold protein with ankyrin repeats isoform X2 [Gavialis gangeticus]